MLKVNISGLPPSMTERRLENLLGEHGRVFQLKMSRDIFSGHCRGRAEVHMEGHEARAAVDALDSKTIDGQTLRVSIPRRKTRQYVGRP